MLSPITDTNNNLLKSSAVAVVEFTSFPVSYLRLCSFSFGLSATIAVLFPQNKPVGSTFLSERSTGHQPNEQVGSYANSLDVSNPSIDR
jgi:hypothetical protein